MSLFSFFFFCHSVNEIRHALETVSIFPGPLQEFDSYLQKQLIVILRISKYHVNDMSVSLCAFRLELGGDSIVPKDLTYLGTCFCLAISRLCFVVIIFLIISPSVFGNGR
jgi:hypothetical protein